MLTWNVQIRHELWGRVLVFDYLMTFPGGYMSYVVFLERRQCTPFYGIEKQTIYVFCIVILAGKGRIYHTKPRGGWKDVWFLKCGLP